MNLREKKAQYEQATGCYIIFIFDIVLLIEKNRIGKSFCRCRQENSNRTGIGD